MLSFILMAAVSSLQHLPNSLISAVQGAGSESLLVGELVTIEGVIVGDFQFSDADVTRDLGGYFVQEESKDEDSDKMTSEGIFVHSSDVDVKLGDLVRVTGTVEEVYGETQISNVVQVTILAEDRLDSVTPARINLYDSTTVTLNDEGYYQPDLEAYEGMLAVFPEVLTISDQSRLARFNELQLVAGDIPYAFTQLNTPNTTEYEEHKRAVGARRITYDDGLNRQNQPIDYLVGFAPYSEETAPRIGDQVEQLVGVLDYKWAGNPVSGSTWRVRAHRDGVNSFTSTSKGNTLNPRPLVPEPVHGSLKVATLHTTSARDANSKVPVQLNKTVNAIVALGADVFGLVELENTFASTNSSTNAAIETLVDAVNAVLGGEVYTALYPGADFVGDDVIAVGIIYNKQKVEVATGSVPALLDDEVVKGLPKFEGHDFASHPIFNGKDTNRIPLAASFNLIGTEEVFTVVVNHFKSKNGPQDYALAAEDPNNNQQDGAEFWNNRRLDGARAVAAWVESNPTQLAAQTENIVLCGDLNSYAMEEPMVFLEENGFVNVEAKEVSSYTYRGEKGTLDYVLVSSPLAKRFEALVWGINSDEAPALDYNLDYGRLEKYYNGHTATRSSDHDPVLVGLSLHTFTWCQADGDCRLYGDTSATCSAKQCQCSEGFSFSNDIHNCFANGESNPQRQIQFAFRLRWPKAVFSKMSHKLRDLLLEVQERVTGTRTEGLYLREGSVVYGGVASVTEEVFTRVVENLGALFEAEIRFEEGLPSVLEGPPMVQVSTPSLECDLPHATASVLVNEECLALSCDNSADLVGAACIPGTPIPSTPVPLTPIPSPDSSRGSDESLSVGIIILLVLASLVCCIILFVGIVLLARRTASGTSSDTPIENHPDYVPSGGYNSSGVTDRMSDSAFNISPPSEHAPFPLSSSMCV